MGAIANLFGGGKTPKPVVAPPPPQVDDAAMRINEQDKAAKLAGRKSTVLTGDSGLPNLGSTTKTGQ